MGRGGDTNGVLQGIRLIWDKKSLGKTSHANHVYQTAAAAGSSGKQGDATSGNQQVYEPPALTLSLWFAWRVLLQETRVCPW